MLLCLRILISCLVAYLGHIESSTVGFLRSIGTSSFTKFPLRDSPCYAS